MTGNKDVRIGGILLAAGGSSRFGRPKQLVKYEGKTLLRRAAEALTGTGCSTTVAVLGASANECRQEIEGLNLRIVVNGEWQTGMSSSIKSGLEKLLELDPALVGVLITLMDQPLITSSHLTTLIEKFAVTRSTIVAAKYSGITGVPALFSREIFDELLRLEADRGARSIIRGRQDVLMITLEEAAIDIDTIADLEDVEHS
jgi:molybdenum cofactor cytidylyltransferase